MRVNVAVLRGLIEDSGHTVASFARAAGVDRSNVTHVLAGRRGASLPTIEDMARALGVPVNVLVAESQGEVA